MSEPSARNVVWHPGLVDAAARRRMLGHGAAVVWLTGLSGSGKSTIATRVEEALVMRGVLAYVLDGDNVRHGLCADLGFSAQDRKENIRRVGEVTRLFWDAGAVVLTAFISPYRADRARVRDRLPDGAFLEVHVATPLEECARRDPKGLWARARRGEIRDFTGLDAPYEAPLAPELVVGDDGGDVEAQVARVLALLEARGVVPRP